MGALNRTVGVTYRVLMFYAIFNIANKEATEPSVPLGLVKVITSNLETRSRDYNYSQTLFSLLLLDHGIN